MPIAVDGEPCAGSTWVTPGCPGAGPGASARPGAWRASGWVRIQKRPVADRVDHLGGDDRRVDAALDAVLEVAPPSPGSPCSPTAAAPGRGVRPSAGRASGWCARTPGTARSTRTGDSAWRSSMNRLSLIATTADFVALYGGWPGTASSPAIDAVLTMCPSPWSSMIGRNARMPCTTPYRLIADDPLPVGERPPPRIALADHAGVVAQHVRRPVALQRHPGEVLHAGLRRGVAHDRVDVASGLGELRLGGPQRRLVDVGEHHAHPLVGERGGQRPADAAGRAGDDGDVAGLDRIGDHVPCAALIRVRRSADSTPREVSGAAPAAGHRHRSVLRLDGDRVARRRRPRRRSVTSCRTATCGPRWSWGR